MASSKRRQGLDQPARDTLGALDRILHDFAQVDVLRDGEFVANTILEKSPELTLAQVNNRLKRMVQAKKLSKRTIRQNGRQCVAYRYVD